MEEVPVAGKLITLPNANLIFEDAVHNAVIGIAEKQGIKINKEEFESEFKKHRDLSRTASAGTFKGGLADTSEKTIRLHTAHHLLLKALQMVLGPQVKQRGSNITSERLRLDWSWLVFVVVSVGGCD